MLAKRQMDMLQAMQQKPMSWTELRTSYYGIERAKLSASTSFFMQLKLMREKGYVIKTLVGYELTEEGRKQIGE